MEGANTISVKRGGGSRTQATSVPFTLGRLDPSETMPLHRQLYDALREAILRGQWRPGARLPATRTLASELGLSRTTVVTAMQQLVAEGYVDGRVGSGTYVAGTLPDTLLRAETVRAAVPSLRPSPRALSHRGRTLIAASDRVQGDVRPVRPFRTGTPALDVFPWRTWGAIERRLARRDRATLRGYGNPAGYGPLRRAVADYLGAARAVCCEPKQVIIVPGAQQALDLVTRILLDPGDAVWFEDPGYHRARRALTAAGVELVPVPVDAEGLDVAAARARRRDARLAYVTPSHQFPLGVTMSLARRLALLQWADAMGGWILEDDYDSEYRYDGRPLAALQGLDTAGRVLYAGTFSKVLFPGLRLGYLVVPPDLVDAFAKARELIDLGAPILPQAVVAEFITAGHFARHLRRMRALYGERQAALIAASQRRLGGLLEMPLAETGLHFMGWLPPDADDRLVAIAARKQGIEVMPLSSLTIEHASRPGLVLGYAPFDERQIEEGIARLTVALGK
ncbi:MAG TPA: PLP-dependent aminotransferase family protein [Ktedonobacterales bacterium]|nr:PLP-dependent aminotransferase family protein [Ktedonobacterales bacterium]